MWIEPGLRDRFLQNCVRVLNILLIMDKTGIINYLLDCIDRHKLASNIYDTSL